MAKNTDLNQEWVDFRAAINPVLAQYGVQGLNYDEIGDAIDFDSPRRAIAEEIEKLPPALQSKGHFFIWDQIDHESPINKGRLTNAFNALPKGKSKANSDMIFEFSMRVLQECGDDNVLRTKALKKSASVLGKLQPDQIKDGALAIWAHIPRGERQLRTELKSLIDNAARKLPSKEEKANLGIMMSGDAASVIRTVDMPPMAQFRMAKAALTGMADEGAIATKASDLFVVACSAIENQAGDDQRQKLSLLAELQYAVKGTSLERRVAQRYRTVASEMTADM